MLLNLNAANPTAYLQAQINVSCENLSTVAACVRSSYADSLLSSRTVVVAGGSDKTNVVAGDYSFCFPGLFHFPG